MHLVTSLAMSSGKVNVDFISDRNFGDTKFAPTSSFSAVSGV